MRNAVFEVPLFDRAIARLIIAMARAPELQMSAEGVEDEDQRALLAAEGCDYFQGFLRAAPMSGEAFEAFIVTQEAACPRQPKCD